MSKRYRHGLKPNACPKCGGADIHVPEGWEKEFYQKHPDVYLHITCRDCGYGVIGKTVLDAIREWNKGE